MFMKRVVKSYKARQGLHWRIRQWVQNASWIENKDYMKDEKYYHCVKDILENSAFQSMENFTQHGTTTTKAHCIQVSYLSFRIAKKMHLDYYTAARGGLLHDLFLYDWHEHASKTGNHFHGFTHPRVALENAKQEFLLSRTEKDIILHHMWPLTVVPPKTKEGFIIVYADKHCSLSEVGMRMKQRFRHNHSGVIDKKG